MPKIADGVPPFVGTRDNLTIYLMNGEYIIRTKSSLTGKRVKRDPAFAKTMMYAGWLKLGARIASHIYRQIPADERVYKQYRELTGKAMSLLKEGFNTGDVITMLEAVYLPLPVEKCSHVSIRKPERELPCYNRGDRPQRAVQVGITGLSYLKYADATDRGLIELLIAQPPNQSYIARSFKELQPVIPPATVS